MWLKHLMPNPVLLLATIAITTASPAPDLFDGFKDDWRKHWREQRLFARSTHYEAIREDGQPVLHARSDRANSGLLRQLNLPAPAHARLAWCWKIRHPLTANRAERTRGGDDYAARVFVVFETSVLPRQTRAINYVWSSHQPVGAVYPSPYTGNVAMIVLRSGAAEAGAWQGESRDVLADYRAFFGGPPRELSAVAVLVDTDNTGLSAEAWFADLRLDAAKP